MTKTVTVRTDPRLRSLLERRAAALGVSLSDAVRDILEQALVERPTGYRTRHLRACLTRPRRDDDAWRQRLRERNWRP